MLCSHLKGGLTTINNVVEHCGMLKYLQAIIYIWSLWQENGVTDYWVQYVYMHLLLCLFLFYTTMNHATADVIVVILM